MSDIVDLEGLTLLLMLIGLAGCILPLVPGPPVMWLGFVVYDVVSWVQDGFSLSEALLLALATVIAAAGATADWWLSGLGARRAGASRRTTFFAVACGLVALLFLPAGGLLAVAAAVTLPAVLVMVLEYRRDRDRGRSVRAGCGYVTGWALATAVELAAGFALLALWLWQVARTAAP